MDQLLKVLEDNATLTPEQLAIMLDKEVGDIRKIGNEIKTDIITKAFCGVEKIRFYSSRIIRHSVNKYALHI